MFKKYTKQLFFYGLLFISGAAYSAADSSDEYRGSSSWGKQPQGTLDKGPLFEECEEFYSKHKKEKESEGKELPPAPQPPQPPKRIISDENFGQLLWRYKTDLPSEEDAKSIVTKLMDEHPDLKFTIPCIKDPDYCEGEHPSSLLFVGPSGCGKTTAAKAVAKYCGAHCVFLKGSQIGNTYQNSGAVLINDLFNGLIERPSNPYIVIIDEFISVSQYTDDDKDRQQRQTAMALWQALDDCQKNRHICVIGTDNGDPEKLPLPIKTRFAYNIFKFHHMNQSDIVTFMKKRLGYSLQSDAENPCSDRTLNQLAQSVNSLSWREIDTLLSKSKMLATHEFHENKYKSPESKLIVKEEHLRKIFDTYREPTWAEKVLNERNTHLRNLVSARAVSLYMTLGGIGLQASD
jgi:AAA+ superfamily predicted ATPase